MAVKLVVTGRGTFAGPNTNIESYTVREQATPLDPTDSRGSVGAISIDLLEDFGPIASRALKNSRAVLTDSTNGYTGGIITAVDSTDGSLSIEIDSEIALAVATVTVAPMQGTIEACVRAWFSVVGVTGGFYFDDELPTQTITLPGWSGDLWVELKQLLSVYAVDISYTSGMITVRPARQRELVRYRDMSNGWSIPDHTIARNIEIYFYENRWATNGVVYPVGGRNISEPTVSVGAGELHSSEIRINGSLAAIAQPVARTEDASNSSGYTIIDKDGGQVSPQEWTANGGFVSVSIDPVDPSIIHLSAYGMRVEARAPYRLATRVGESDYPSLVIVGTGTLTTKQLVTLPTGADEALITSDVGVTVDNRYISSRNQAYDVGMRTSRKFAGPDVAINFTSWRVNALGATDSKRRLTFDEFDAEWDTKNSAATFDSFDTFWGTTSTFDSFNAVYAEMFQLEFQNQAFGNVAGSRMKSNHAYFRVREATISPTSVSGTAEHDTMYKDFDNIWANATFAQFNSSVWAGLTFDDHAVAPLWR